MNSNAVTYFDTFGVNHISEEAQKFIGNKNITNIYRMQANNLTIKRNLCIGFIYFMFKDKSLAGLSNLFSTNNFKYNDEIILNYF